LLYTILWLSFLLQNLSQNLSQILIKLIKIRKIREFEKFFKQVFSEQNILIKYISNKNLLWLFWTTKYNSKIRMFHGEDWLFPRWNEYFILQCLDQCLEYNSYWLQYLFMYHKTLEVRYRSIVTREKLSCQMYERNWSCPSKLFELRACRTNMKDFSFREILASTQEIQLIQLIW